MSYTKKVWKDAPDTSTPINAANLNHMENGIAEADVNAQNALDRLDDVDDEITQINSDLSHISVSSLDKMDFSVNAQGNSYITFAINQNDWVLVAFDIVQLQIIVSVTHDAGRTWQQLMAK